MVSVSLSVQVREWCKLNIRSGFLCMCVMVSRESVESEREERHTEGDTNIKKYDASQTEGKKCILVTTRVKSCLVTS